MISDIMLPALGRVNVAAAFVRGFAATRQSRAATQAIITEVADIGSFA